MRAVGLITEYNPFHNGHLHHLRESRRQIDAEVAVAVMSGHFLQRGEPALVDKWVRTEMALAAGVDVVVEIPFPFACNSAPYFAAGAVQALTALGVDHLCFGSESGDLETLRTAARFLTQHEEALEAATLLRLRQGQNYPEARAAVVLELGAAGTAAVLASPNNILGIAYLRALERCASPLRPWTIPRVGAGYHATEAVGTIASATGIRRLLADGEPVLRYLPETVQLPFLRALNRGAHNDQDHLHRLLLGRILRGPASLRSLYQVEEGLENRLFEAALASSGYDDLVDRVKSRHWTRTRVQRILAHLLNECTAEAMTAFLAAGPLYLHLLGTTARGRRYLAARRKSLSLPLIGNYSRIHPLLKRRYGADSPACRLAEAMLDTELRATRNYTLLMKSWNGANRHRDFVEEVRWEK